MRAMSARSISRSRAAWPGVGKSHWRGCLRTC
jgi:hypothetical protein